MVDHVYFYAMLDRIAESAGSDLRVSRLWRLGRGAPSGDPAGVPLYCCGGVALGGLQGQTQCRWDGTVGT
jgi:hypothetical protein